MKKIKVIIIIFILLVGIGIYNYSVSKRSKNIAINVNGSTVTMNVGKNDLIVQICKDNLVKVNYFVNGKEEKDTDVISNQNWNAVKADINIKSNPIIIKTDKMLIKIDKNTCRISFYDAKGKELIKEQDVANVYKEGVKFNHNNGENFYGISGYNATEDSEDGILRNTGNVVTAGEQGHCGGPLVWSTSGYGVLVDSKGGNFSIDDAKLEFTGSSRKDLEYYVISGQPKEILSGVADISGKSPMFPKWATGFTNSEWGIDENELLKTVKTYREKQIPIDNYTLDFDWKAWGEDNYGEFRWNEKKFPDGSTGKLKSILDTEGIKLTGILKPRIHVDTVEGKYADENKFWHPYSQVQNDYFSGKPVNNLDFSNKDCRTWFFNNLKNDYNTGIVGWWNDEADEVYDDVEFLNMEKAIYEGQCSISNNRVWSINRNFYLGSQKYAYGMWSGDIQTGFESMANQRERMLSAINLGEAKWGMDTGGFNGGNPDPQNYARWMEFSAFTPIFRVHGNLNEQRQPWVFGPVAEAAAKKAMQLRYKLIPYIYSYDRTAYESGVGIVRPLVFDYPSDPKVANCIDSWMFGDYLLASPVVDQDQAVKEIYLPKGTWTDYFTGKLYEGGQTIKYEVNSTKWDDIPLFIKQGAIIPSQDYMNYVGEKPVKNIYLDIFPDSNLTSFDYYDDDGTTYNYEKGDYFKQKISTQINSNSVSINMDNIIGSFKPEAQNYILKVHGVKGSNININGNTPGFSGNYDSLLNNNTENYSIGSDIYGDVTYIKVTVGKKTEIQINK